MLPIAFTRSTHQGQSFHIRVVRVLQFPTSQHPGEPALHFRLLVSFPNGGMAQFPLRNFLYAISFTQFPSRNFLHVDTFLSLGIRSRPISLRIPPSRAGHRRPITNREMLVALSEEASDAPLCRRLYSNHPDHSRPCRHPNVCVRAV